MYISPGRAAGGNPGVPEGTGRFRGSLLVVFKTPEMHIPPWYWFSTTTTLCKKGTLNAYSWLPDHTIDSFISVPSSKQFRPRTHKAEEATLSCGEYGFGMGLYGWDLPKARCIIDQSQGKEGREALLAGMMVDAIYSSNSEAVRLLLDSGVDASGQGPIGDPFLLHAMSKLSSGGGGGKCRGCRRNPGGCRRPAPRVR